jgi:arylsulfatase A-like enzyme
MLKRWREAARSLPSPDSPNVLLIVLDTVRADHLSVYGYARPTTLNLEILAHGGIRFDQARAAAPWTLASHATLFTGRWPHELGSRWMHPMRGDVPTLSLHMAPKRMADSSHLMQ